MTGAHTESIGSARYGKVPEALWGVFGLGALWGLLTPNPLLTVASIMLLPAFMTILWRPGETPVLLFAISFQWLQVTGKVFHANVLGVDVTQLSKYAVGDLPSVEKAIWLSMVGLVILALGMRFGMRKLKAASEVRDYEEARWFSTERAFVLYLGCTLLASVLEANAWSVGGFIQVLRAAVNIRWVGFFILGYLVLKRRERYSLFAMAVAMEFIAGIGFFSGFKTVLFVTLIVVFAVRYELRSGTVVAGTVLLVALVFFGAAWTSVKGEYRSFLNQGTRSQAILVSQSDQLDKLVELVGGLSWDDVSHSMGEMFDRLAYVDYFALVTDYVPQYVPHEGGELWMGAVRHVFMPRVFFPSKPPLTPDSQVTMRYTGLHLASDREGTSISIGYMGESYVDFGPLGMFAPIFVLGVLWGTIYSYFLSRARSTIVGYAFATAVLVTAYQFEMTGIKLLGGILMDFIVLALIMRFAEKPVTSWLRRTDGRKLVASESWAH